MAVSVSVFVDNFSALGVCVCVRASAYHLISRWQWQHFLIVSTPDTRDLGKDFCYFRFSFITADDAADYGDDCHADYACLLVE